MGGVVGGLMIAAAWFWFEWSSRNEHRPKVEPLDETWTAFYSGEWRVR